MFYYKTGDRICFHQAWDPGFAPDDPFYIEPIPEGQQGKVLDVAANHVRIRLDDHNRWPSPITVWQDGAFPDDIPGGVQCMHKIPNH